MKENRSNLISTIKGLCIFLMVIGHSGCPMIMHDFIYMFHMPVFFFCSGYCFKEDRLNAPITYLKKRFKGLYWPFVSFSILALLLHNLLFYLHIFENQYSLRDIAISAFDIIIRMRGNPNDVALTGTFWFFRNLLFASIVGFFYIKYFKNSIFLGSILCTLLSLILNVTNHGIPFVNINYVCFMSLSFFLFGFYISKKSYKLSNIQCLCAFIIVLIGSIYFPSEMILMPSSCLLPYTICAIAGIILLFNIFNKFTPPILIYLGNNSIYIMIWHLLCFKLVSYFIILCYGLPIEMLSQHPVIKEYATRGWWILYTIVGTTASLLFIKVTNIIIRK